MLAARTVKQFGANRWFIEWARCCEDDVRLIWDQCPNGAWAAEFLIRIGFDFDSVAALLLDVVEIPWLHNQLCLELKWRTPESMYNAIVRFCDITDVPICDVAEMYRAAFDRETVFTKIIEMLR